MRGEKEVWPVAAIRSLFELTHAELIAKPALRRFAPFKEQTIRAGWFKWYWLGHSQESLHTLVVGPFYFRRSARRAWDRVPKIEGPEGQMAQMMADLGPHRRSLTSKFPE
jgi:hypothetical protein